VNAVYIFQNELKGGLVMHLFVTGAQVMHICTQRFRRGMFVVEEDEKAVTDCALSEEGDAAVIVVDKIALVAVRWGDVPSAVEDVFCYSLRDEGPEAEAARAGGPSLLSHVHITSSVILLVTSGVMQVWRLPEEETNAETPSAKARMSRRQSNFHGDQEARSGATRQQRRHLMFQQYDMLADQASEESESEDKLISFDLPKKPVVAISRELFLVMREWNMEAQPLATTPGALGSSAVIAEFQGHTIFDEKAGLLAAYDSDSATIAIHVIPSALMTRKKSAADADTPFVLMPHWVVFCATEEPLDPGARVCMRLVPAEYRMVCTSNNQFVDRRLEWDWAEAIRKLEDKSRKEHVTGIRRDIAGEKTSIRVRESEMKLPSNADRQQVRSESRKQSLSQASHLSHVSSSGTRELDEMSRIERGSTASATGSNKAQTLMEEYGSFFVEQDEDSEEVRDAVKWTRLHLAKTAQEASHVARRELPRLRPGSGARPLTANHKLTRRHVERDFRDADAFEEVAAPLPEHVISVVSVCSDTSHRAKRPATGRLDPSTPEPVELFKSTEHSGTIETEVVQRPVSSRPTTQRRRKAPLYDRAVTTAPSQSEHSEMWLPRQCHSARAPTRKPMANRQAGMKASERLNTPGPRSVFGKDQEGYARSHRKLAHDFPVAVVTPLTKALLHKIPEPGLVRRALASL